ncbi:hypothetical protein C8F04DRAFT_1257121 [Mycena alexandri]|uniref:Uncharacterized protein n=1 Tax=Mycena alexandri TaxID=1745969 RepID=A0AAD6T1S2_9AGAR|nr:hypothetical protein C8F04DRAFT_1257121 [Mycena alexandri]
MHKGLCKCLPGPHAVTDDRLKDIPGIPGSPTPANPRAHHRIFAETEKSLSSVISPDSAHANPIQQLEPMAHIQILLGLCNVILGLSIGRTSFLSDSIKLLVEWAMSVHLKPDAPDNTSHDDLHKQILLDLPTDPNATRRALDIASPLSVNDLPARRDADTLVETGEVRWPELLRPPYWNPPRIAAHEPMHDMQYGLVGVWSSWAWRGTSSEEDGTPYLGFQGVLSSATLHQLAQAGEDR